MNVKRWMLLIVVAACAGACGGWSVGTPPPSGQLALVGLRAFPITGSTDRIYIEGRIVNGTTTPEVLLGGESPSGTIQIAGAAGCREMVAIWPDMPIAAGQTIVLSRSGPFLLIDSPSTTSNPLTVTLRFKNAGEISATASVEPAASDDWKDIPPGVACPS